MNFAEFTRQIKAVTYNIGITIQEGVMGYDRKKIKKTWNTGNYQLVVICSDGD